MTPCTLCTPSRRDAPAVAPASTAFVGRPGPEGGAPAGTHRARAGFSAVRRALGKTGSETGKKGERGVCRTEAAVQAPDRRMVKEKGLEAGAVDRRS